MKDVRDVNGNVESVDLICGGFPCQDLSVAGKRAGLAGERSGLFFEFVRIAREKSPQWLLIENVPGLLSSDGGRCFATVIRSLVELGYGVAWRVLDAQYLGLAQRRKRVFIVGCLGDARRAVQVLFEPESVSRDPPPSREAGAGTANGIARSLRGRGNASHREDSDNYVTHPLKAVGCDASEDGTGRGTPIVSITLTVDGAQSCDPEMEPLVPAFDGRPGRKCLKAGRTPEIWSALHGVRRLTPTECERLQGFPDGWTDNLSDTARYRALGNAVAVPVAQWIGKRIMEDHNGNHR